MRADLAREIENLLYAYAERIDSGDLDGVAELFTHGRIHGVEGGGPETVFEGRDKVRENWTSVFAGIPDFRAELLASASVGDTVEIGEWHWRGTHTDGTPFAMAGVTVMGIEHQRIAWGRLYMEVIEQDSGDIDAMVRETYRPPD